MDNEKLANLLFNKDIKDATYYFEKYQKRNIDEKSLVTRFAPSPTGFIHMGSLYTAFINDTFAHQTNGVFFLRIEDTDQKRKVENGIEGIIKDLNDYKFDINEGPNIGGNYGPYIQSERKDIYQSFAKSLVIKGLAYPCFCTEEILEEIRFSQERSKKRIGYYGKYARCRNLSYEEIEENIKNNVPYVIRLKSNGNFENKIVLNDLIKGKIEMPENDIDVIILKSDGIPTYHFAHAVDDYLMGTTTVIRGDEWVSSYPVHYDLFKTLEFKLPNYAHIALLTKKDEETGNIRKLSKRHDPEASVSYYTKKGIPNYVVKLYLATILNPDFEPWYALNYDKSYKEFVFDFSKMSIGGSLYDLNKLMSISKIYFSHLKANDLYEETLKYNEIYDKEFYELLSKYKDYTINILNIEREIERPRKDIDSYSSVKNIICYMYDELFDKKYIGLEKKDFYNYELLKDYMDNYYNENDSKEDWFNKIKELASNHGFAKETKDYKQNPELYKGSVGDVCELIRVAVTGRTQTPDLYEILKLLGNERIKERFAYFKEIL